MFFIGLQVDRGEFCIASSDIDAAHNVYFGELILALTERHRFGAFMPKILRMTIEFTKPAEDLPKAACVSNNVKAFAEVGVATSRRAFD